ncbi:MAG: protein kinase [Muribaculaceae bacterium]|nr:protein kinase [Muribaculaceae bacterium]
MAMLIDRCEFNVGDVIEGRYRVVGILGEGSFGKVYKVSDHNSTVYALKLLRLWDVHPDIREILIKRFKMEYETGRINCENLVQASDFGVIGGNPFIVMEFCSGGDLTPLLGNAVERTPSICRDILCGLNALHMQGKVHRDLKPENVLFKSTGIAALTDFGIAGDRNHRMTERNILGRPKQMFGTYAYMPPEQVNRSRGQATVLPTTDIFSFGVLTYQLLTGRLPFGQLEGLSDLPDYQKRAKNGEWSKSCVLRMPYGDVWAELFSGCLAPSIKDRYQSVRTVMEVLERLPEVPGSNFVRQPVMPAFNSAMDVSRPKGCALRLLQGEGYGNVYPLDAMLGAGHILTIGRDADNSLHLVESHSSYLSRKHCCIEVDDSRLSWTIRDGQWDKANRMWKNSSNGTFVNSTQVTELGHKLSDGDIIAIGDFRLRFEKNG